LHQVHDAQFFQAALNYSGPYLALLQFLKLQTIYNFLRAPNQIVNKEWLGDEFFDAFDDGPEFLFDITAAGQKNKRNLLGLLAHAKFLVKLAAIETRHAVITNYEVGRIVHYFQKRVGAIRGSSRIAMRHQPFHQEVEDQSVIIDHQDFHIFPERHRFTRLPARV